MNHLTVHSLHIYPIKSCGGISVQNTAIDKYGFENDRRWLLVDENGQFITQRDCSELSLVQPEIDGEILKVTFKKSTIEIPIQAKTEHQFYTSVWDSEQLSVYDEGNAAADFFSEAIKGKCRLVRRSESYERVVTSGKIIGEHNISFVDSHPILIVTQNSLKELNNRLDETLLPDRFRPNIIVEGDCEGFDEDNWRIIGINNQLFDFGKRCSRCVVTTINQQTAEKGTEPLQELASFRRDHRGKVCFGAYYTNRQATGNLSVGNPVVIHNSESNPLDASIN